MLVLEWKSVGILTHHQITVYRLNNSCAPILKGYLRKLRGFSICRRINRVLDWITYLRIRRVVGLGRGSLGTTLAGNRMEKAFRERVKCVDGGLGLLLVRGDSQIR